MKGVTDGMEELEMDFMVSSLNNKRNNSGLLPLKKKSQFSNCTATLVLESNDFDKQDGQGLGPDTSETPIAQLEAPKMHFWNRGVRCLALSLRYVSLFFFLMLFCFYFLSHITEPFRAYSVVRVAHTNTS